MRKILKLLSFVLSIALIMCSLCVCAWAEETPLLGDIDKDGTLSTEDARVILRMSCEIIPADVSVADMNGDGIVSVEDAVVALYEAINQGGIVIPDKNGENQIDDKPTNEFIKLIADTYNLDPASLVAIYSIPDSGTNYVLEFDNTGTLFHKEYEKSVDNLKKVYHIGIAPNRTISYTDGNLVGGSHYNCTAAEGWMVFNLVKKDVMAQHPDYFIL